MNSRLFFHRHFIGALILGSLCLWASEKIRVPQQAQFSSLPYRLSAPFFKFVTAGFWPAAVDALWIRTIQVVGTANYSQETLPAALDFYKLATDLDPNFYELYEQAGVLFIFFYEAPDAAQEILNKGIRAYESGKVPAKFWTHPYTLYIFLANTYAFQMNDWSKAKDAFLRASQVPRAPQYLSLMRPWLEKEGSEKILAQKTLRLLIQNTEDEVIRKKYEGMLKRYEN